MIYYQKWRSKSAAGSGPPIDCHVEYDDCHIATNHKFIKVKFHLTCETFIDLNSKDFEIVEVELQHEEFEPDPEWFSSLDDEHTL